MTPSWTALHWGAAMAGLAAAGGLGAGYWWREWRRERRERRKTVFCCGNCGNVYLGERGGGAECPRCGRPAGAEEGKERT
ncbi:MAG: hypothetical protein IK066_05690 [Kiritimatiellae bacterium]|nr:hypothetical protein [Kiritimatiellia bacterium]